VGNIETDAFNYITDVALSRSLAAQNFCSWYSESGEFRAVRCSSEQSSAV
jgi:hypothetical protein